MNPNRTWTSNIFLEWPEPNLNLKNGAQVNQTKPEPLKYFEPELNLNSNRYLKRFDTLLLMLRRRIVSREDVLPTDSFILKQFFRLFHLDFHLSVDQSLTLLTQRHTGL